MSGSISDSSLDESLRHELSQRLDEEMVSALWSHGWLTKACQRCRPVICLRDGLGVWGRCVKDAGGYRIELVTKLILEHPWYAVREVLLHETAHFLVMYLHPGLSEPPHGPVFCRICGKLGGTVHASGTYPPLDSTLFLDDASEASQVSPMALKIRKLLALSESPNEHEAQLALCKARELMVRHGISSVEDSLDPYVTADIRLGASRMPAEESSLMSLLSGFYGVRCLVSHEWVIVGGELSRQCVVSVSGHRSKVKVALYVRDYVWRCVGEWGQARCGSRGRGVRARRDYALGFLCGMREALERQEQQGGESWGLVRASEAGLDAYFRARYPKVRQVFRRGVQSDATSRNEGYEAGRSVTIHPGIGDDVVSPQRLRLKE